MLVLFDKISSKLLYLIEVNGSLRDLNGLPFANLGNGILKDVNGRRYYVDENKLTNTDIYGVEWDITLATTTLTRVGKMSLHNATTGLPIQNGMKRCLLLDNGTVNYYLDPNDSTKKENGDPSILDGTDGQVMVEIPEHYRRFEYIGSKRRVVISEETFEGAELVPLQYISAFEATVFRPENKLSSVINTSADYRGGNNNSSWDAEDRSLLGKPATILSRINFTEYATNRGVKWFQMLYETYKTVVWLYMIEYAQRNSQATFNPDLTLDGFRQGGLGEGVTNIGSSTWSNFNDFYPFLNCGEGGMNNFTSSTAITHPVLGATQIPVYRGIEHPFGHVWKWAEGINIRSIAGGNIEMYTANGYQFSANNYDNYTFQGNASTSNGYIRTLISGASSGHVEILPSDTSGASATTFWSDLYFQSRPSSGESLRAVRFGGGASAGVAAGLLRSFVDSVPSGTSSNVGGRLCFVPNA